MNSSATLEALPRRAAALRGWAAGAAYVGMIAAAVGLFLAVRGVGEGLAAPAAPAGAVSVGAPKAGAVDVVRHVLATLAAVIGLGYALGRVLRHFGQPPVIGEVVAGVALGPSLLGAISPTAMHWLIPGPDADPNGLVTTALKAVAQLGVVLYMFLVGLEMNAAQFRDHARSTVTVAHAGIAAQFAVAAPLTLVLYPGYAGPGVGFTGFALFLCVALSVTGFTVLSRILTDFRLSTTPVGAAALGCAAADDVTAWCLVAVAAGVVRTDLGGAAAVVAGAMAFVGFLFLAVRPAAEWVCRRWDRRGEGVSGGTGVAVTRSPAHPLTPSAGKPLPPLAVPGVFVAVLLSALATEAIGVHAVFGAFLLGAVIPHDSGLAREFTRKLKDVVTVLLLPAFFALTGLRTEIGLLAGWQAWGLCAAIIAVATLGKFGGTLAAARLSGYGWRTAAALGVLMNTRGLMGLIVLDVGLGMGVISPTLFAMMVLMALATTLATAPLVRRLAPDGG